MDAEQIIRQLGLKLHPGEGGFFRETYRSADTLAHQALGNRYPSDRSLSTAIYYLLTPENFSAIHRLRSDEIFHFYLGDPVTMLLLYPDGRGETRTLGQDVEAGHLLQALVPHSVWQGLYLKEGGRFALLGTTLAPGFDPEDFELGERNTLVHRYPKFSSLIERLTHEQQKTSA